MGNCHMRETSTDIAPDIDAPIRQTVSSSAPEPSAEQVSLLADMGFTTAQAKKALRETVRFSYAKLYYLLTCVLKGGDPERAVEWLFSHPDDMGDEPTGPATSAPSPEEQSSHGGSAELPAKYRLKAFISHKGPSVHSGHYVAHIRKFGNDQADENDGWVLFNDEKVVKADRESVKDLKRFAYLYIFERV